MGKVRTVMYKSDLSGTLAEARDAAMITVKPLDESGVWVLYVTADEAAELAAQGTKKNPRKPRESKTPEVAGKK